MKKVLVTGANGQLGQTLQNLSEIEDFRDIDFIFFSSTELDITNQEQTATVFERYSFDYCINCAAYTAVDLAEDQEKTAFAVNAEAVKLLAQLCLAHNVILIHISTDFVFDGKKNTPYQETDFTNPINVYGASKLAGEHYITSYLKKYFIFRTSWLYSEYGNNFLKTMLRLGKERKELSVVNDQVGSPTYARDLALAILHIINSNHKNYGIYHYSNKGIISWYDFAKEIFREAKLETQLQAIPTSAYPTPANRPKYSALDHENVVKTLGVRIRDWKESLSLAISKLALKGF